jgi:pimeloyl-ACP methyl ester carboxylesterase
MVDATTTPSFFTSSDGARLAYTDEGPRDGRPAVLVAGYAMPATGWALQSDALLAAGYRVVAFDRRSHGASDDVLFGQRIARHGADIHELLTTLDLRGAVLVGQSMGASSIWAMLDLVGTGADSASAGPSAGDTARVAGVLTIDQTPKMVNTDDWQHGFYGMDAAHSGTFFDDGIPDTGRGLRVDQAQPGVQRLVARIGGMPAVRQANAPSTVRLLRDHGLQDWRDVITRLDIPFLMVAGRNSQLWPCSHAAAAVGENPFGRVAIVEDAGHATNLDQPDAFDELLLGFLAEL